MSEPDFQHDDGYSLRTRVVKDMPSDEQPREKLMNLGAENLTNAELIAILLRTGTQKMNVLDTSKALLHESGGLHRLAKRTWKHTRLMHGIGNVKAVTIEAAMELSRRLQRDDDSAEVQMKEPKQVAEFFGPMLRDQRKEIFIVVFLNSRKVMLGYDRISVGTQTATLVDTSEIMRQALLNDAHSIIAIHNHPSGNAHVSNADISLTEKIFKAGKMMNIRLEDHVIIAGNKHISLRAKGFMDALG